MQLTKLLLILLFFSLPLVHGNLLPTLGIPFSLSVSGNFEFTKVMFFNIFSGLIFLSFFVEGLIAKYLLAQSQLPPSFGHLPLRRRLIELFSSPSKRGITCEASRGSCDYVRRNIFVSFFIFILLLSTLFSTSPFISLIGDTEKGHTALMYLNLLGLFSILKNLEKAFLQKLFLTSLLSGVCISLLALKEFFFPSFDYGELANRALGSFGHPNYLAGYLLLLIPLTGSLFPFSKERIKIGLGKEVIQVWVIFSLIILTLLLTKSIVALFLAVGYIIYTLQSALSPGRRELERGVAGAQRNLMRRVLVIGITGTLALLSLTFLIQYSPEKLHSFLSRFYLWETTLKIIFSDIKIFFIGAGAETLPYFFDSFKVPEVSIYENFGYTADRAHNFLLDIFFQFGIFGVLLFLYCIFSLFQREYPKGEGLFFSPAKISLLLFLLFGIFHYFSIASYLMLVFILVLIANNHKLISESFLFSREKSYKTAVFFPGKGRKFRESLWSREKNLIQHLVILILTLVSLTGSYFSIELYRAELAFTSGNTKQAQEIFSHPKYLIELGKYEEAEKREGLLSQNNLKEQIITEPERQQNCDTLTGLFPSAENHFYCGNIFWKLGKVDIAKNYYRQGIRKLPDLWESDSAYWQQYFVHKSITGHRFFSEDFSDISEILQKLEIPIESKK